MTGECEPVLLRRCKPRFAVKQGEIEFHGLGCLVHIPELHQSSKLGYSSLFLTHAQAFCSCPFSLKTCLDANQVLAHRVGAQPTGRVGYAHGGDS